MNRGLEFLALDLTHRCNLNCSFCGKLVSSSDFQITMKQLETFCELCNELPATFVRISGGEVTTHPKFRQMIQMIIGEMQRPIELATNGLLLHKYEDMMHLFKIVHITIYPGINDEAVAHFRSYPNVNIITLDKIYDPYYDPNWTVEQGQAAYDRCCRAQVNVSDGKVYGCCLAEPLERRNGLKGVHVELRPGWIEEYKQMSCIEACRHCFMAAETRWG